MHTGQGQSHSAAKESGVQPDHLTIGDFIAYEGRLMPRVRGGENVGGAPAAADAGGEPNAGGAGQGEGLGLYTDLLTEVPEHLRPVVEPVLKKMEGKVTQRFQEHSDFRKQWEPLQGVEGLADLQADELSELVEFRRDVLADPEKMREWWEQLGQQAGWMTDDVSGGDDDDDDDEGDIPPHVAELQSQVQELSQAVQQLVAGHQTQEQRAAQEAAKTAINTELKELAEEHLGEGKQFDDETRDAILTFALRYGDDPEAIAKGFKDLQKIKGGAQSSLVDDVLEQPAAANRGGRPDTAPAEVKDFAQAKQLARARRQAAVGT